MSFSFKQEALDYHASPKPGKIASAITSGLARTFPASEPQKAIA